MSVAIYLVDPIVFPDGSAYVVTKMGGEYAKAFESEVSHSIGECGYARVSIALTPEQVQQIALAWQRRADNVTPPQDSAPRGNSVTPSGTAPAPSDSREQAPTPSPTARGRGRPPRPRTRTSR